MATAPAPHANNFLAPEPFIVARLQAALASEQPAVHVLTASELAGVKEESQHVPAVHVVWGGFKVPETRADGAASRLQHTWLAVAVVRNVRGLRGGAAARADAGELVAKVGAALMGFRPPGVSGPMLLAPAPRAMHSPGYVYLPLAFTVESIFKAA